MIMKNICIVSLIVFIGALFSFCSNRTASLRTDTMTSGIAEITVDECLAPVIQEMVDVFEGLNSEATIIPIYTNEAEAYDLFMKDSVRLIIGTRKLSDYEENIVAERKQKLRTTLLAIDGIAIIINKENNDSLLSVNDLKKIMSGEITSWKELNPTSGLGRISIVFDSPSSSTVHYIQDSICGGKPFTSTNIRAISDDRAIVAATSGSPNMQVIDYVSSNPNSLGIIGVNWISNPNDTTNLSFNNKIRVMALSNDEEATLSNSYKPYAAYLALGKYPLKREVYSIISDVFGGLPSGFVNFAGGEKGQRIVLKSGLFPANQPTRVVRINRD